jgi:hypothetical protein
VRRLAIVALTAPAAILVVAACGTTHAPTSAPSASASRPSASPSPSAVNYGKQYLADVTPLNNADDAVGKARTNKQNIRAYTRLSRIEMSTAAKMLRQVWPTSAEADVQAFAEALSVESGDDTDVAGDFKIDPSAHSIGDNITYTAGASSMSDDLNRDNTDSNKSTALAQKCRADLGLPPVS